MSANVAKKPKQQNVEDKEQSRRFVETAKALGVDKSGKSFERAVKKLITSPEKKNPRI